jgi:hypothetical protein
MEPAILTIFCLISFLFFVFGGVIGWFLNNITHAFLNKGNHIIMHPEMLDENGNILPDEILAIRFENDYDDSNNDEEEEDN